MKQAGIDVNAEIARNEGSLLRLIEGFERYKLQLTEAYEYSQEMLVRGQRGFSCPEKAALHEEKLSHAIQAYFRLREQIGWWLEQVRQIVAALTEIERQVSSMDAPPPGFKRERMLRRRFEGKPGMLFIELEKVF